MGVVRKPDGTWEVYVLGELVESDEGVIIEY